jgi:hypothetical protein
MVDVTLDPGAVDLGTISMNPQGGATYDFTVPADAVTGAHTLSFTGETSKGVATFTFTVGIPSGTGTGTGGGGGGGSSGGLAFTGAYVLGPLAAAVVLLGGGTLLASYRRRRRHG